MPVFPGAFFDALTPAQCRARDRQIRDAVRVHARRYDAWLRHYRALGLGELRASGYASTKASAGRDAPR